MAQLIIKGSRKIAQFYTGNAQQRRLLVLLLKEIAGISVMPNAELVYADITCEQVCDITNIRMEIEPMLREMDSEAADEFISLVPDYIIPILASVKLESAA